MKEIIVTNKGTTIRNPGPTTEEFIEKLNTDFKNKQQVKKARHTKVAKAMEELIALGLSNETAKLITRYTPPPGDAKPDKK